jgi:hypothetical protein
MQQSEGSKIFVELIGLRDRAGNIHYFRIKLADQCLMDKGWVESVEGGGGDENKAIDRLERECFGDLVGVVSLPQMLEVLHHFPQEVQWKKHKFNLGKMWQEYQSSKKAERRTKPKGEYHPPKEFVEPLAFVEMTNGEKKHEYQRVFRALETKDEKIAQLERENAELRAELARIKAAIRGTAVA